TPRTPTWPVPALALRACEFPRWRFGLVFPRWRFGLVSPSCRGARRRRFRAGAENVAPGCMPSALAVCTGAVCDLRLQRPRTLPDPATAARWGRRAETEPAPRGFMP